MSTQESSADAMVGALSGLKVVEIASENAAYAGKLLADMGASVTLVEPPGGHATRGYGPFAGDVPDPESSLWWWFYNTSKRSVTADLASEQGRRDLARLIDDADVVLEAEPVGELADLGLDYDDIRGTHPDLVWASITPFGRTGTRAREAATDLTLLAAGGPVWSCGYDDHNLPPVRGGGYQSLHIAGIFAAMSILTALVHRQSGGSGQLIDVNMYAAANVTTESSSFEWLVGGKTVQRQTGRHALTFATSDVQVLAGDDKYVTTGFAPNSEGDFAMLLAWLDELGIRDDFEAAPFLQMGVERGGVNPHALEDDPLAEQIFATGRDALVFIASRLSAYAFFIGAQQRNFQCGIIYAPEEALEDVHFMERGFPVQVEHPDLGRSVTYPGAPFKMSATPIRISRAPKIGEHDEVGRA